jgi:hypothetical protein
MSVESVSISLEKQEKQKKHALFISGMKGTDNDLLRIGSGLRGEYGGENVTMFNSIFSTDTPNRQRFETMADVIQERAATGLDIVVHSLGAEELRRAVKILKKRDKEFFDKLENAENLRIVLVAPSGFSQGVKERIQYTKGFLNILKHHDHEMSTLFARDDSVLRGLESLHIFPLDNAADVTQKLTETAPEWSQKRGKTDIVRFDEPQSNKNYIERKLNPEEQVYLSEVDRRLQTALAEDSIEVARNLIVERGKVLRPVLSSFYGCEFEPGLTSEEKKRKLPQRMGKFLVIRSLMRAGGGKAVKEFSKLSKEGVQVDWLVPEYDCIVPLKTAEKYYDSLGDDANGMIKLLEGATHISVPSQQEIFARSASGSKKAD